MSDESDFAGSAGTLGRGRHTVRITRAETGTSLRGSAQVEVWLENGEASIRDCVVITPETIGRIVSLIDAASLPRPFGDDVEDPYTGKLSQSYCDKLVGRRVHILVREERTGDDPPRTRRIITGYHPSLPRQGFVAF
jgi:hypothetical protein